MKRKQIAPDIDAWVQAAEQAYYQEITTAEAAGLVADERAAQEAAERAVRAAFKATPDDVERLQTEAATRIVQQVHKRVTDRGKRQISDVASGQLGFRDLEDLGFIVPIGEGQLSTFGALNLERLEQAEELRKQNLFNAQGTYKDWTERVYRPLRTAVRTVPGSTVGEAIRSGRVL